MAEVPVMPSSIYSVYSRGSISLQMQDGAGGFCCFFGCRGGEFSRFLDFLSRLADIRTVKTVAEDVSFCKRRCTD